jgi:RNA polymerase sigma-70 factor (ECF subfamily)
MALGQSFDSVISAAQLGSDWAWAAIYREIAGPITGFLRARGVDDAQDAAGDVFFEVSRNIDTFKGTEDQFQTMVFAFAYQRMQDEKYASSRSRSRLADRVLDRIKRDAGDIDDGVSPMVLRAFESLSQEQRDILALRVAGGLSVEQTAEVVDLEADSVRSTQRRALGRIRRRMAAEFSI